MLPASKVLIVPTSTVNFVILPLVTSKSITLAFFIIATLISAKSIFKLSTSLLKNVSSPSILAFTATLPAEIVVARFDFTSPNSIFVYLLVIAS